MESVSEQELLATYSWMFLPPSPSLFPPTSTNSWRRQQLDWANRGPALPSMFEAERAAASQESSDIRVAEGESRLITVSKAV